MVKFLPTDKIKPGSILARDVHGVDTYTGQVVTLKAGQVLTMAHITKLIGLDLTGAYVSAEYSFDSDIVDEASKSAVIKRVREIYNISEKATEGLYAKNIDLANQVLEKLIDTIIDSKDLYLDINDLRLYDDLTYNHALGVTILSISIGRQLRITRQNLAELALSALIHDIGKTQIPIDIIQKPAKLTPDEYEIVKTHVKLGHDMLCDKNVVPERVLDGVISHHERFDGKGYPYNLKGKQIPFFGRIIACADVYDALTSQRPYRAPTPANEAIEYIMGNAGLQFDSGVVKAFLRCVSPYPIGSCVKLSNGETAIIAEQNPKNPLRPKIFMMGTPQKTIDLYTDKHFYNIVISNLLEI